MQLRGGNRDQGLHDRSIERLKIRKRNQIVKFDPAAKMLDLTDFGPGGVRPPDGDPGPHGQAEATLCGHVHRNHPRNRWVAARR